MLEDWEKRLAEKIRPAEDKILRKTGRPLCPTCNLMKLTQEEIEALRRRAAPEDLMWLRWCTCRYADMHGLRRAEKERVYFAGDLDQGYVKVGFSCKVEWRMAGIQTGCPFKVKLFGVIQAPQRVERALHRYLQPWRSQGEWFHASPEVKEVVALAASGELERMVWDWLGRAKPTDQIDMRVVMGKPHPRLVRKLKRA